MTVKSVNITILSNGLGAVPPGGGLKRRFIGQPVFSFPCPVDVRRRA